MTDSKGDGPKAVPQAIRWDDAGIKSSYVNACNVASTREEVVLNLGLNHTWERGQPDAQVQVTNRIILNPHTAKRLGMLLGAVVQQYEKQFGVLDIGTAQAQALPEGENKPHVVK